jgi:deazaflavin-dependent oxidoreductase (nitroreductase family)
MLLYESNYIKKGGLRRKNVTVELTPKGTRGAQMPHLPRPLMKGMQGLMRGMARLSGNRFVLLTTVGAKTGQAHTVALGRFPDGENAFLVVASNAGAASHPAWYINMAKHPDQVWAEVGGRKLKVRAQALHGAEREAAMQRVIAAAPGYAAYQEKTDREIPVVRLVPEEGAGR